MQVIGSEAFEQLGEIRFAKNLTFDSFVARVVRELHGIDCIDIEVQQLNWRENDKSGHEHLAYYRNVQIPTCSGNTADLFPQ